ncbi:hypothetical protein BJ875DRAFT_467420 [Amylocarpus encephaloides]|uniref:TPR-like protein n=1 Tax=Amylocarpus encephaloides TaxID=45428 RepID=A0A9P8C394_9HELO|nr:hypothetical protein BJ875DRAFT_467420 [Amylocarpus encephaloides]
MRELLPRPSSGKEAHQDSLPGRLTQPINLEPDRPPNLDPQLLQSRSQSGDSQQRVSKSRAYPTQTTSTSYDMLFGAHIAQSEMQIAAYSPIPHRSNYASGGGSGGWGSQFSSNSYPPPILEAMYRTDQVMEIDGPYETISSSRATSVTQGDATFSGTDIIHPLVDSSHNQTRFIPNSDHISPSNGQLLYENQIAVQSTEPVSSQLSGYTPILDQSISEPQDESARSRAKSREKSYEMPEGGNANVSDDESEYQISDKEQPEEEEEEEGRDSDEISDADSEYLDFKERMVKWDQDVKKLRALGGAAAKSKPQATRGKGGKRRFRGGGRGSNPHRGPRKAAELTPDLKLRVGRATQLFIQSRYKEAMELVDEIIGMNSETHEAWTLKAEMYKEDGDLEKAVEALYYAAHLRYKHVEGWIYCAEFALEETGSLRPTFLKIVQNCYARALRADRLSLKAHFGKADTYYEREMYLMASREYETILMKYSLHNLTALQRLAEVSVEMDDVAAAKNLYASAVEFYKAGGQCEKFVFGWSDAIAYAELFAYTNEYARALKELKSLARWLLGREDEKFWDTVTLDDSEWDIDDSRRQKAPDYNREAFQPESYGSGLPMEIRVKFGIYRLHLDHYEEAMLHLEWLDPTNKTGNGIVSSYTHVCREAADQLCNLRWHKTALIFYEPLQKFSEDCTASMYTQIGKCHLSEGRDAEAEEYFQMSVDMDADDTEARIQLARLLEKRGQPQMAYDMVSQVRAIQRRRNPPKTRRNYKTAPTRNIDDHEIRNSWPGLVPLLPKGASGSFQPRTLPLLVPKPPTSREESSETAARSAMSAPPVQIPRLEIRSRRPPTDEQILEMEIDRHQELHQQYIVLGRELDRMRAGHLEGRKAWMDAARYLINNFRAVKALYPYDKTLKFTGYNANESAQAQAPLTLELDAMAARLSKSLGADVEDRANVIPAGIPDNYRGMSFKAWLDIFLEFAICLAKQGKRRDAYDICVSVKDCIVWFHSRDDMFILHLCWCMCALILNDEETLLNVTRFFVKDYQFSTDTYRLIAVFARTIQAPISWYNAGPTQKFLLRQIRSMDYSLTPDKSRRPEHAGARAPFSAVDDDGRLIINDDLDISLLMLYGHMLSLGNSHVYALNYFMRAYDLDPTNPMINLTIGLSHIHHGMKRQSENRQHSVLQGLSFVFDYYNSRKESLNIEERLEAHYNVARTYHILGVPHLAIPYYWRVLNEAGEDIKEDVVTETAYNLQLIYTVAGNIELAQDVVREWLTI